MGEELDQDERAFLNEQLLASQDEEPPVRADQQEKDAHSIKTQEQDGYSESEGDNAGEATGEDEEADGKNEGKSEENNDPSEDRKPWSLDAPEPWPDAHPFQEQSEIPQMNEAAQAKLQGSPHTITQEEERQQLPDPKPSSAASTRKKSDSSSIKIRGGGNSQQLDPNGGQLERRTESQQPPSLGKATTPEGVHGARPPPVYVVAPPALIMDPALNPRDVVGMSGQRNSQPCPLRHIRKLANTCELEQQLAYVFQEGGEGEEATTIKVDIVERLCRKYNKTAMALLETRAYAQAKELLLKAQVLSEENGILAAHPALRLRLQSITLNNLGCYHCRLNKMPAALKVLQQAVQLEQQASKEEGEEREQAQRPDTWGFETVEDASEDPSSTLLNLCAVLGMLGRHREALQYAQDAAQMLCRSNGLEQEQLEDWCAVQGPPAMPPCMPHAKFGHDPVSGRPFTAPFPPPPPKSAHSLISSRTAPQGSRCTHNLGPLSCARPSSVDWQQSAHPHKHSSHSGRRPHPRESEDGLQGSPGSDDYAAPISLPSSPGSPPSNNHSPAADQSMRMRNNRPSPLGVPPSPSPVSHDHRTLQQQQQQQQHQRHTQQAQQHFHHRLHRHLQEQQAQPHHPQQHHPSHSHSHFLHELGGRSSPPPLSYNSSVGAYKQYVHEHRQRHSVGGGSLSLCSLPSLSSPSTMPSPVGFPKHPLPANAPRAAHVLHSMRPELVNLLVMSYFSRGVQAEHLNELHNAFCAYALAASLPARIFGRSAHLAMRFSKAFHAFKIKHKRYFAGQQAQEHKEARRLAEIRGELAHDHTPYQKKNVSIATLLGTTRVCHPTPESLVRKQILESYEQDYDPMPPEPEAILSSQALMQLHMQKLQCMKQGKLTFL